VPVDNLDTRCREEHVGGTHPYKKNKTATFCHVLFYPIITYN